MRCPTQKVAGLLGLNFLSNFRTDIDTQKGMLYLEKKIGPLIPRRCREFFILIRWPASNPFYSSSNKTGGTVPVDF